MVGESNYFPCLNNFKSMQINRAKSRYILMDGATTMVALKNSNLKRKFFWNLTVFSVQDYWVQFPDPDIMPCGYWDFKRNKFSLENSITEKLMHNLDTLNGLKRFDPPKGYTKPFVWKDYLKEQNTYALPFHLFNEVSKAPFFCCFFRA
jgi:hypothetical protein